MSEHISLTPDPATVARHALRKGDRVELRASVDDVVGFVGIVSAVDDETGEVTIDVPPVESFGWVCHEVPTT